MKDYHATIPVESHSTHGQEQKDLLAPDVTMILLTWITFFVLLGILSKFAWNPILDVLDVREKKIRQSVDDADRLEKELAIIDQTRQGILKDAEAEAKETLNQARKGAVEAAKVIEGRAKEEAKIVLGNAEHEVRTKKEKAHMDLRQESLEVALSLAGKLIDENLTEVKQRKLIDKFIKDFAPKDYEKR